MSALPRWGRDQFERLVRLSFGRMLDAATGSREIGAELYVLWSAALLITPPLFYTVTQTSAYPWLRFRSLELLQQAALVDRLFFVVWSMLGAMLLATTLWEALLPDRADQQVLGVLPVPTRTVAAARLVAALIVGGGFALAVSVPTAVLYSVAAAVHPVVGSVPSILAGHLISTWLAAMSVFVLMLVIRGVLVAAFGAAVAGTMAVVLQFVTVLALFETFMFLPGIVRGLVTDLLGGGSRLLIWPPGWFLSVYADIAGPRPEVAGIVSNRAWMVAGVAPCLAAAAYLLPARINARRAIEARVLTARSSLGTRVIGGVARVLLRAEPSRALFRFVATSLMRSRRQLLRVATYLGFGVAIAGTRIISAVGRERAVPLDAPYDYLVAIPLVLTFALVVGLRSAFATPTDASANWVFRLTASREARSCARAATAVLATFGVLPITLLTAAAATGLWGARVGLALTAMHLVSGIVLAVLTARWLRFIPFTRPDDVDPSSIKLGLPLALVGLHAFAFRLDDLQLMALNTAGGVLSYATTGLVLAVAVGYVRPQHAESPLSFDAEVDEAAQLRLSGSAG